MKIYVKCPTGNRILAFSRKDAEKVAARIEGATILSIPASR